MTGVKWGYYPATTWIVIQQRWGDVYLRTHSGLCREKGGTKAAPVARLDDSYPPLRQPSSGARTAAAARELLGMVQPERRAFRFGLCLIPRLEDGRQLAALADDPR